MLTNTVFRFALTVMSLFSSLLITPGLYITSPADDSIVSGIVEIRGSIPAADFSSAEISYAYADSSSGNWFVIKEIDESLQDVVLATWDTTTITDGDYRLKLSVTLENGNVNEVLVDSIHVMNYTHSDSTPTPGAEDIPELVTITAEPPEDDFGPTQIPANPAAADEEQLRTSILAGVSMAVFSLILILVYSAIRGSRNRR